MSANIFSGKSPFLGLKDPKSGSNEKKRIVKEPLPYSALVKLIVR